MNFNCFFRGKEEQVHLWARSGNLSDDSIPYLLTLHMCSLLNDAVHDSHYFGGGQVAHIVTVGIEKVAPKLSVRRPELYHSDCTVRHFVIRLSSDFDLGSFLGPIHQISQDIKSSVD